MVGLLDNCNRLFGTKNLYDVLAVSHASSNSDIKRGYHRLSLKVHPDRVGDDEKLLATEQFQTLGKVYAVLSDPNHRAAYDETGEVDDEGDVIDVNRDWAAYWRLLFTKFTEQDIIEFENKYKGSQAEIDDLKTEYVNRKGDIFSIIDSVMCATDDDEQRFTEILSPLVDSGELPDFPAFRKDNTRKRNARKKKHAQEAAEADAAKSESTFNGNDSLHNMIQQRQQNRAKQMESFFSDLEAKYAKPKQAKKNTQEKSSTNTSTKSRSSKRK